MAGETAASRRLLEEYSKRDPKMAKYLAMYDKVNACASNPKACAVGAAKEQMFQYLSNQTGIPVGDLTRCADNPQGCAEQAAITYAASATGISPEVISGALSCAKSGNKEECAKTGLKLAAVAACTAYTAGLGTIACTEAAPVVINFAWPHIKNVVNLATFGMGIDGMIDAFTFGVGMDLIMAPLKAIKSLVSWGSGPERGKVSDETKWQIFWNMVKITNNTKNGAIKGLWNGALAARGHAQEQVGGVGGAAGAAVGTMGKFGAALQGGFGSYHLGCASAPINGFGAISWSLRNPEGENSKPIEMPYMNIVASQRKRIEAKILDWIRQEGFLKGSRDGARSYVKGFKFEASTESQKKFFDALGKERRATYEYEAHVDYLKPPWPYPVRGKPTDMDIARILFTEAFEQKLKEVGFEAPASITSNKGKKVILTGRAPFWWEWTWKNVCTNCTQNDMDIFVKIVTRLFMENRIAKIEPVLVHFIDVFAKDHADKVAAATPPLIPLKAKQPKQAEPKSLILPGRSKPMIDITGLMKRDKKETIPIHKLSKRAPTNVFESAWQWSKENPKWSVPAAVGGLALIGVAGYMLTGGRFVKNLPSRLAPYQCPCGADTYVTGRLRNGDPFGNCLEGHFVPQTFAITTPLPAEAKKDFPSSREIIELEPFVEPVPVEKIVEPVPAEVVVSPSKHKFVPAPDPSSGWVQIRGTEFSGVLHVRPARYRQHLRAKLTKSGCTAMGGTGEKVVIHKPSCRPSRPRCRWMRKLKGLCYCDAYDYPHREGSGYCRLGIHHLVASEYDIRRHPKTGQLYSWYIPRSVPEDVDALRTGSSVPPDSDGPVPF